MKTTVCLLLLASSMFALASNPYYEIPCQEQANNIRSLTVLRDKGYSKNEIISVIKQTYPNDYHDTLIALLDTVFTLKSQSPQQMYKTTKSDCENYGKKQKTTPLFDAPGTKPRGYLSGGDKKSCLELSKTIDIDRDALTSYERKLEVMSTILQSSMDQINSRGGAVSKERIDQHNSNAKKFEELNAEYQTYAKKYNEEVERYNNQCGGKALR